MQLKDLIGKINAQPDLTDTREYLAQITTKVKDIQQRLGEIQAERKLDPTLNMHKAETVYVANEASAMQNETRSHTNKELENILRDSHKLLDVHLPELINKYCQMTIKYRNEMIVKTEHTDKGDIEYTGKTLLLRDLGLLMQQAQTLEDRINECSLTEFLGKSRLLTDNFGIQSNFKINEQSGLELEEEKRVEFKNNFDYSLFKKKHEEEEAKRIVLERESLFKVAPIVVPPKPRVEPQKIVMNGNIITFASREMSPVIGEVFKEENVQINPELTKVEIPEVPNDKSDKVGFVLAGTVMIMLVVGAVNFFTGGAPSVNETRIASEIQAVSTYAKTNYSDFSHITAENLVAAMPGATVKEGVLVDKDGIRFQIKNIGDKAFALVPYISSGSSTALSNILDSRGVTHADLSNGGMEAIISNRIVNKLN